MRAFSSSVFGAVALTVSTTIGAGVLALPKALYQTGPAGILVMLLVSFFLVISASMAWDMLRREKKPVQLPSLLADVLGEKWKIPIYLTLTFAMYGALTAYLIGFEDQLSVLTGYGFAASLLLFLTASFILFRGTKLIEDIDKPLALLLIFFLLLMISLNVLNFNSLSFSSPSLRDYFTMAGTSLFALFGLNVLPEANFLSGGRGRRVYIISTLICLLLYISFALSTIGVLGSNVSELGTEALARHYGGAFKLLISLFTLFALFTSFLGISLSLKHIYNFDFGIERKDSALLTLLPPLLLFLLSKRYGIGFLQILSAAGELTLPFFLIALSIAYLKVLPALKPATPFPRLSAYLSLLFFSSLLLSFFLA